MRPETGLEPARRRPVYFAFQGLFMAVLLLLVLLRPGPRDTPALGALASLLLGSLLALRLVGDATLSREWFQSTLFVGDALVAALVIGRTRTGSDLFLLYLLLVFGSALTRSARQRLAVAGLTVVLFLATGWRGRGWAASEEFWLRALFLAVSAALMAVLARDAGQARDDERRLYESRLVQVERLATLGRVAGEVAHRIKAPLTTIAVDADVLAQRHADDPATRRELDEIRAEVERCKGILKDLLDLGRIEEMDVEPLDLRAPARAALSSLETLAKSRRVRLAVSGLDRPLPARGDATLLREALSALLQNALEASPQGGEIRVSARTAGGVHRVCVADDGSGLEPAELVRAFEPFFTTKKGVGTGLGLSAALRIAAKHGGTVEGESAGRGRGARFTLAIPAAPR
ncbi:MAG: hypothetical protein KGM24_05795 [Elusimicrobia bacterium]|nr:hypothetical protein [Elusimicrobiota bacterium]